MLGDRHLTRPEVDAGLRERGHDLDGQALMLLLAHLELCLHICSGAPADGVHTYAAVASRVPSSRRLDRDEALAEVALRYVTSHGPATERDLAYWATLTLTDVRAGLAAVALGWRRSSTTAARTGTRTARSRRPTREPAHLLQILDEIYRGYQDSRMVLDADGLVPGGRELGLGMALVDGQLVAGMKRTVSTPGSSSTSRPLPRSRLRRACRRWRTPPPATARFLGRDAEVRAVGEQQQQAGDSIAGEQGGGGPGGSAGQGRGEDDALGSSRATQR